MPQNCSRERSSDLMKRPASGIRMMTESHVKVSPVVRPNPGKVLRRCGTPFTTFPKWLACGPTLVLVDLVEDAAFGEVFFLRPGPTTENVIDGEQFHLGEGFFVFLGDLAIAR